MAYGRLDVFWPDGQFQTFPLAEPTVSVGRSSGNTISLDSDNISRYHFNLTHKDGQTYITDLGSANGTFLNGGIRLKPGKPHALRSGERFSLSGARHLFEVRN